MTFKKLALAAAIAVAPMGVQAVDMLDDSNLGDVTGQDGIAIRLGLDVTTDVLVHDLNGIDAAYQAGWDVGAGAIVMSGVRIATPVGQTLLVEVDAGDSATTTVSPTLNVHVTIPNNTILETGTLTVANSNRDNANGWGTGTLSGAIMNNATITLGTVQLNVQLGNEPQGNMIAINSTITSGLSISNFGLNDAGGSITGGTIGAGLTTIVDNGGTNLTVDVGVDVDATRGLVITVNQLGSGTGIDVRLERQYLGTTTLGYVGDVELRGVNLNNNTIAVSGK